ncbi:MAG: hypothetical protein HND46_13495 [Chloroflexi bacterium]|nr:hypothetical protein [Chloroflexota bacterium]NOG64426.1 hypothetical protein [Chloroflexota bacterium]
MPHTIDHIELLIVTSDGRRLRFVGAGELVEVDNIEPHHTPMMVKAYIAPIIDLMTGVEVARLHLGDTVSVYTHVRRPHAGAPHKMIAAGEWKGYYIPESAIERVLPDTKPTPTEDDWTEAPG